MPRLSQNRRWGHPSPQVTQNPRRLGCQTVPMPTSVLSDGTIRRLVAEGRVRIEPWDEGMVQPASVDLRLGASFRVFHNHRITALDLPDPPRNLTEHVEIGDDESFV